MLTYITNECMPLEKMLARVQKQHPGDSYLLVEKAYKFAEQAHAGHPPALAQGIEPGQARPPGPPAVRTGRVRRHDDPVLPPLARRRP